MFRKLTLTVLLALMLVAPVQAAMTYRPTTDFKSGCIEVRKGINYYRTKTWYWQDQLGYLRTKSNFITKVKPTSCMYAYWVAQRWTLRAQYFHQRYINELNSPTTRFWKSVAQCETGGVLGYPLWDWGKFQRPKEGDTYEGAVGFLNTTWDDWAAELNLLNRFPAAYDAPMLVQIRVAEHGLRVHRGYWGCLQ